MSTTPEATDEAITRFRLDGLREHVGRIWAAMHGNEERGPQDYPPWDDERRILINIIRKQTESGGGGYTEAPKGSNTVIIGCTIAVISAGIVGGIALSNQFAALRAEFSEWKTATEYRLQQLERRP
jgi:hypothetical protein